MSTPPELDRATILADLAALERTEADLSQLRRRLHEALERGSYPYQLLLVRERHVSAARRGLHARIDELRARLQSTP